MYEVILLVSQHCDVSSLICICIAADWKIDHLNEIVCRGCAEKKKRIVQISKLILEQKFVKFNLFALLQYDTYMYARRRDADGNKVDGQLRLYKVDVTDYHAAPYRYSEGAKVIGEYQAVDVSVGRIFASLSKSEMQEYTDWIKDSSCLFDDDGARCAMESHVGGNSPKNLVPVFGFIDSGRVFARSAQQLAVNPFLLVVRRNASEDGT